MRNLLPKLLVLVATSLPIAAHADTVLIGTGSFTLIDLALSSQAGPYYLHLTISPQTSTPEPSTLPLLATGIIGLVSIICYRTRRLPARIGRTSQIP
jgi:hypothetical protein